MATPDALSKTDEELVRLSLGGTWNFALLIGRYEEKIRRYISRLGVTSPEDREDLLQDIFIKVYQNLNSFDPSMKFSSWIYRIAHNETMSFFRTQAARPHGHLEAMTDEAFQSLASDVDILKELEGKDASDEVLQSVGALDEKYKDIVVLKYFEHKSYEEISDILRIPPGTVAIRLNRAKENIRKLMQNNGYIHE